MRQNLHLVNETKHTGLFVLLPLPLPASQARLHDQVLQSHRRPALESVGPDPAEDVPGGYPRAGGGVRGLVRRGVVADSYAWVEVDAARSRERVVGVNEAAFRALEVVPRQGVGDAPEAETGGGRNEWLSGHDDWANQGRRKTEYGTIR